MEITRLYRQLHLFPRQSRVNTAALQTETLIVEVEQVQNTFHRLFFDKLKLNECRSAGPLSEVCFV